MAAQENSLYTLIPFEDFKALLGVDDREDKIARFCIVTSTLTIEQYCKRKLLRKKYFERIDYTGDLILPLREYPVSKLLAVYSMSNEQAPAKLAIEKSNGDLLEPEFYSVLPDCGTDYDLPFSLELSPALLRYRGLSAVKVAYWAGYANGKIPADLASACLELASWNLNRYLGRRIGMTGNIRGAGKEGEHFEMSMPSNVRALLEPYRRKTI